MSLMPPHDPPYRAREVRDLYARGTWAYALGKSAWTHPKYKAAVALAKRKQFNPWWIRNWGDVEATIAGCWMDEAHGIRACQFFELLRHFEDELAGQPFRLADWQKYDITIPIFGWKRPDGNRRFRVGYVEIPKKNGKTSWAAAVQIYMLIGDDQQGAENYSAANDREQASVMFRSALEMAQASPAISKLLEFIPSRYRIVYRQNASFYRALSYRPKGAHGLKPHFIGIDETHEFPNADFYDALIYGGRNRPQPLVMCFTTAGVYNPTSLGWRLHAQANMIRNGEAYTNWSFFPYVCGLDDDEVAEWNTPAMCIKSNPNVGITFTLEKDKEQCSLVESDPAAENNSKRLLRNVWPAQQHAWMRMDRWAACAGTYSEDELAGLTCYGGIDCSLSEDISALVLWFPPQVGQERHRFLCRFWVPEDGVAAFDHEYAGMYSAWIKTGHLRTTPGPTINQDAIRAEVNALAENHQIRTIGYDRMFASELAKNLEADGFDVGPFNQGVTATNEPTLKLMELVLNGELEHPDHPVMNWHIGNCQAEFRNGLIRLAKNSSGTGGKAQMRFKIDGASAAVNALGTSLLDENPIIESADQLIR